MRHVRTIGLSALILSVAACGGGDGAGGPSSDGGASFEDAAGFHDAAPRLDAMPPELACLGEQLPSTAADPIAVSGRSKELTLNGTEDLAAVAITAYQIYPAAPDEALDSTTSAENGDFSLSLMSGDVPIDGYLVGTKADYLDVRVYPPQPIYEDLSAAPVTLITPASMSLIASISGVSLMSEMGVIIVVVFDCNGDPAAGAQISTDGMVGKTVYLNENSLPDEELDQTTSAGAAILFNVAPGDVLVDAAVGGDSFRERLVVTEVGLITYVGIRP